MIYQYVFCIVFLLFFFYQNVDPNMLMFIDFVVEIVHYKNTTFTLFDVGGPKSETHRPIWAEYLKNTTCKRIKDRFLFRIPIS